MNDTNKITPVDIANAWKKFIDYMEIAEPQHHTGLAILHGMMYPLYDDLLENWSNHRAEFFMDNMNVIFHNFEIN